MFRLIQLLASIQSELGMSLATIMAIVKAIMELGLPPALDDDKFQEWTMNLLGILKEIAAQTETPIDDKAVAFLLGAANNDGTWVILRGLLKLIEQRNPEPILVVGAESAVNLSTIVDVGGAMGVEYTEGEKIKVQDLIAACNECEDSDHPIMAESMSITALITVASVIVQLIRMIKR